MYTPDNGEVFKDVYINGEKTKYQISNIGTLIYRETGKVVKLHEDYKGYMKTWLSLNDGTHFHTCIHRLVAAAFIPNPENKPTVNHIIPGRYGKKINTVWTLEWATYQEQRDYAVACGCFPDFLKGVDNANSKYTEDQIRHVCELLEKDVLPQRRISEITGVSKDTINKIRKNKQWRHISSEYNISSKNKLNTYDESLKKKIIYYIRKGYTAKEIMVILKLPKMQASFSLVYNIRHSLKKDKGSTTIERIS